MKSICCLFVMLSAHVIVADEVLNTSSLWRSFTYWSPAVMGASAQPAPRRGPSPTALPPADWMASGFDDTMWERMPGPFFAADREVRRQVGGGLGQSPDLAVLAVRGRFGVPDPAKVKELRLTVAYRGGVVVYVNGQAMARGHLPAGKIEPDTLADDYPDEAYHTPEGGVLSSDNGANFPEAIAKRTRQLNVTIPASALQKGANVLALEFHRAALSTVIEDYPGGRADWNTVALDSVSLTADPPTAALADRSTAPVAVANAGPMEQVTDDWYACAFEPLRPVRVVAPRNGVASGQVVLSGPAVIADIAAQVSDLKGPGTIPAGAVQVRYAARTSLLPGDPAPLRYRWHDVLSPVPPRDQNVVPVWVTVRVPADAPGGRYEGNIAIKAGGMSFNIPLQLTVAPWKCPDPRAMGAHVGLIQSPESVAMKYGIAPWSDAHLKVLEESHRLLGAAGAKAAHITLIAKTHFGNDQTMLRWTKTPTGLKPDFTIVDKYLDLWARQVGPPQVLTLYVWDFRCGGQAGAINTVNTGKPMQVKGGAWTRLPVTLVDGTEDTAPTWTDADAEAFWRPAFEGIRQRVRQRGWDEKCIMLGIGGDSRPDAAQLATFKKLAPDARWVLRTHTSTPDILGHPVGIAANEGEVGRGPRSYLAVVFPRDYHPYEGGGTIGNNSPPWTYRQLLLRSFVRTGRLEGGIGGVGADFWPVDEWGALYDRFIGWGHLSLKCTTTHLLAPGPTGPLATQRLEMLREGNQEAQAFIEIAAALADPARKTQLGPQAGKAEQVIGLWRHKIAGSDGPVEWYPNAPWQQWTEELYTVAGEVQTAHGARR